MSASPNAGAPKPAAAAPPPTEAQRRAADPRRSFWVTANAGSGKTRVLAERVARLLLDDAPPDAILCLTFTRAAAAEMAQRVEARLAAWATIDDDALKAELEALEGRAPGPAKMRRARTLLARVLDAPQGLAITTIHAFAKSLLRRFPLEAGVPPRFDALAERDAAELLAAARAEALRAAIGGGPLGAALDLLARALPDRGVGAIIDETVKARFALRRLMARHGGLDGVEEELRRRLDLDPHDDEERLLARAVFADEDAAQALRAASEALIAHGKQEARARGERIAAWLEADRPISREAFEAYAAAFFTDKGELRKRLMDKGSERAAPTAIETLLREAERLIRVRAKLAAARALTRTMAALRLGAVAIGRVEEESARRAAFDFDAQIALAGDLLAPEANPSWVHFKLDRRIDHILVDEAQDTSPAQWRIIERLAEPLFELPPAERSKPRTLFVVGDDKQSIYGFQGADVEAFRAVRGRLRAHLARVGDQLHDLELVRNFRSSEAVLQLVDRLFASEDARKGVAETPIRHEAARAGSRGVVEIWPLEPPSAPDPARDPWTPTDGGGAPDDAEARVASKVADAIEALLAEGAICPSTNRPYAPGDILALLRRRGTLQDLLVRQLKRRGLPVAGADRLPLNDHIAVMDLAALGRAVLLPEDDLTLAALLKSPLFGLDDRHLLRLTEERGERSLRRQLARLARDNAGGDDSLARANARLEAWAARADFVPPFEFFARALAEPLAPPPAGFDRPVAGMELFRRRLGEETVEPIEAFLAQALAFERGRAATLEGFLRWLDAEEDEVKRDAEPARSEIRILTIHGAKGLEAPAVFLADAGPRRARAKREKLLWDPDDVAAPPIWRGEPTPLAERWAAAERERDLGEERRLLYVALTRARDRLYLAGRADRSEGSESWRDQCGAALASFEDAHAFERALAAGGVGDALRRATGVEPDEATAPRPARAAVVAEPAWALRPPPSESKRAVIDVEASDAEPNLAGARDLVDAEAAAFGLAVHQLLQFLPETAPEARDAAIARWLAVGDGALDPARRREAARRAQAMLDDPILAPLMTPMPGVVVKAEASLRGALGGRAIAGRIDRLAIGPADLWLVDFKTGRPPPDAAATPRPILRQMARYRALLEAIAPGKEIHALVAWTRVGRIDRLASASLRPHMPPFAPSPASSSSEEDAD